jgi:hypothetical protein
MKKNHLFWALALCTSVCLSSCNETKDPDGGLLEEPKGEMELLSPDAQKDLLVEVGEELLNTFNPEDQRAAVELADELYYKYKRYDWDQIYEDFEEEFEDIYSREFDSFFSLPRRLAGAITDKQSVSLENMEILLTLSKFGYVIEFDDKTKSVKMTETDDASITVKFSDTDGTKCEAKVWGEGKEIEGSYTYEDGHWDWGYDEYGNYYDNGWVAEGKRTIRVKVPKTIKMHLKHGNEALISFTFNWDSNLEDYANTSMNLQVINLKFAEETKVNTTTASAVCSFSYGDKPLVAAAANLPKYELISWEGGNDITEEEGENWLEEYDDKYASLLGKVGAGEAKVDILGKVQIKGGVTDGAALVDAYHNWEDKYNNYNWEDYNRTFTYTWVYEYWDWWYDEYGNWNEGYKTVYEEQEGSYNAWWERPYYTLKAKQEQCNFLNKYAYLSVYYNNTVTEQAKFMMDIYEKQETYDPAEWLRYDSEYTNLPDPIQYSYYGVEPIMYFPQEETSIAITTYFNSSKFLGLIDLVEDLANSYIALDKHNLIFGDDFKVEIY